MPITVLYARCSTADQQVEIQREQAEAAGFQIDEVVEDQGVSGVSTTLQERTGGSRLFDMLRDGDTLLVRWIDRLGRNYDDISKNMRHFLDKGVTIKTVINGMTFDAKPKDAMAKAVRDAMLSFMSAMAEANAVAMKEAQAAGIAHAKEKNPNTFKGRKPTFKYGDVRNVMELRLRGIGVNEIARQLGLNKFLVSRIHRDPAGHLDKLNRWYDSDGNDGEYINQYNEWWENAPTQVKETIDQSVGVRREFLNPDNREFFNADKRDGKTALQRNKEEIERRKAVAEERNKETKVLDHGINAGLKSSLKKKSGGHGGKTKLSSS